MMGEQIWICPDFSLSQTLESGQCFRYQKEKEEQYTVISGRRVAKLGQVGDSIVFFNDADIEYWKGYFDGGRDYVAVKRRLSAHDPVLKQAIAFAPGVRILKQVFFETLLSFILSQNNHIPRIQGLIQRLSETYGEPLAGGLYAFPTPEALANVTEVDYRRLGCGFRGRYLEDAVRHVLAGGFSVAELEQLSTEELRSRLMEICGVGRKVADCVLLFSFGRHEVFPSDVWIQRVFSLAYHDGQKLSQKDLQRLAAERFGADAGFAQQYLFYYARENKIGRESGKL